MATQIAPTESSNIESETDLTKSETDPAESKTDLTKSKADPPERKTDVSKSETDPADIVSGQSVRSGTTAAVPATGMAPGRTR